MQHLSDGVGEVRGHDGVLAEVFGGTVTGQGVQQDATGGDKGGGEVRVVAVLREQRADKTCKAIARASGVPRTPVMKSF